MKRMMLTENTPQSNYSLDTFKLILILMVVFIHTRIFINSSILLDTFTSNGIFRIAVPVFFIINGYFLPTKISSLIKWAGKLILIYLFLTFLYSYFWLNTEDVRAGIKSVIYAFFIGYLHLWYIQAMVIGGIIIYFTKNKKMLLSIALFFYIIGFALQLYHSYQYVYTDSVSYKYYVYRNVFTIGIPFMLIGYLIKSEVIKIKPTTTMLLATMVLFLIEIQVNYSLFSSITNNNRSLTFDTYFSLLFFCPVIFSYVLNLKKGWRINRNIANYVYFIHPLPMLILERALPNVGNIIFSITVLIITLIMSIGLASIKRK